MGQLCLKGLLAEAFLEAGEFGVDEVEGVPGVAVLEDGEEVFAEVAVPGGGEDLAFDGADPAGVGDVFDFDEDGVDVDLVEGLEGLRVAGELVVGGAEFEGEGGGELGVAHVEDVLGLAEVGDEAEVAAGAGALDVGPLAQDVGADVEGGGAQAGEEGEAGGVRFLVFPRPRRLLPSWRAPLPLFLLAQR